ncbi:MAG TPA: RNA polymerase sigma factor [Ktedonobacterales bacterium]|nr:RNA polymerase sigma factor [Ktedonobacterales bacterium]
METEASAAEEDRRLLARIATGDEVALDTLYARYRPRLRGYLWRLLDGDGGLVEEALQDIFLAVWQTAARFRGEAQVATWLFRIAHNIAFTARQRGARHPSSAPLLAAEAPHARAQHDPYGEAVISRLAVHDALGRLSDKHREALDLFFRQGFSADEIAAILGIPSGTVRSRLSYARKALREELQEPRELDRPYGSASSQPRAGEER